MAFGLYVGFCGCGLCLLFCWFADFLVWIFVKTLLRMYVKTTSKSWKTTSKINRDLSKILPKSTQKRSHIDENTSLERLRRQIAPRSAPGRFQIAPCNLGSRVFLIFLPKMAPWGLIVVAGRPPTPLDAGRWSKPFESKKLAETDDTGA